MDDLLNIFTPLKAHDENKLIMRKQGIIRESFTILINDYLI
jgi:hypothetical protein